MSMTKARNGMSLLTKEKRSRYFQFLGLGEYNKDNILKFQKIAFTNPKEHDGKYGTKTDYALRHWYNVKNNCNPKTFRPEEFRCPCGRCSGYPVQMKAKELRILQQIRDHYGRPMTITSGLRCSYQNARVGGIKSSRHMLGRAADFYIPGVTTSLAGRKSVIAFAKKQKNFRYGYCNGYNSYGRSVRYPKMGSAVHIDSE